MKQGPGRLRRLVTAGAAGTIALSFLSVLAITTPASAAPTLSGTTIAASAPSMVPTLANQPAGNLTVTLTPGATGSGNTCLGGPAPGRIQMQVRDFNEGVTVAFDHIPTVAAPSTVGNAGFAICTNAARAPSIAGNLLSIFYQDTSATTVNQAINITNIAYDTVGSAAGPVLVRGLATDTGYANSGVLNNISPLSASLDGIGNPYDPSASNAAISTPSAVGIFADTTPAIGPGTTQAAGAWELPMTGVGNQWNTGDKLYITVARNNLTNCETAGSPDSVGFSAVPTLSFQAAFNGASTTPTATASLASMGSCSTFSGINNVLVITFTNSGTISTGTATDNFGHTYAAEITVSGVSYAVSADVNSFGINQGNVQVTRPPGYNTPPTFGNSLIAGSVPNDKLTSPTNAGSATGGASNANITITSVTVVANKPSVTFQANNTSTGVAVTNQAISPITISEGAPGSMGGGVTGYACVELASSPGFSQEWNATTSTPTATLGGGFGTSTIPVTVETTGTQTGPGTLEFQIPTASTGTPGTITLSGLAMNLNFQTSFFPIGRASFFYGGINAACQGATPYAKNSFVVVDGALRTFGQTQDATAAQIFNQVPPACAPGVPSATNETPAVLVTNGSYQDALSASYLAGQLGTSVLTTPTATLSQDALNALRLAGVTEVFVVGGPLAVSQANVTQLQNTPSFNCGGVSQRTTIDGQPVNLVVQQIFGQTADGTAAAVATFPGAGVPGTGNFQGAYSGQFNDTTGSSGSPASSAPDTPVTTAILATDQSFTDAASASAVAYKSHFPLLLTGPSTLSPDAVTALTNDAVQQVIVMGGPIAISDNVISQVEALGISVLRVAGQDFTDTSQLLAQFEVNSVNGAGLTNGLDYEPFYITIARGDYYTDAIVASRYTGLTSTPILLTWDPNNEGNPSGTNYLGPFLTSVGQTTLDPGTPTDGTVNILFLIGGPFAISPALATTIATSLNG